jgi:hypothetical protein
MIKFENNEKSVFHFVSNCSCIQGYISILSSILHVSLCITWLYFSTLEKFIKEPMSSILMCNSKNKFRRWLKMWQWRDPEVVFLVVMKFLQSSCYLCGRYPLAKTMHGSTSPHHSLSVKFLMKIKYLRKRCTVCRLRRQLCILNVNVYSSL